MLPDNKFESNVSVVSISNGPQVVGIVFVNLFWCSLSTVSLVRLLSCDGSVPENLFTAMLNKFRFVKEPKISILPVN